MSRHALFEPPTAAEITDRLDRIRRGLAALRDLDPACAQFGARSHGYALGDPVSEDSVAAIEAEHGFRFPEDYRRFLIELGNGGAGPSYGVFPLGMRDQGFALAPWGSWVTKASEPFPHRDAFNPTELLDEGMPREEDFEDDQGELDQDAFDAAMRAFDRSDRREENEAVYWGSMALGVGSIPLCHHGCAQRSWLIVTGPEAGTVWEDMLADQCGVAPTKVDDQARVSFTEWYLHWLESTLAKAGTQD